MLRPLPLLLAGACATRTPIPPAAAPPSSAPAECAREAVPSGPPPAEVTAVIGKIERARLVAIVEKLAGFGTRHTLSDTKSPTRGIGAARNWIRQEILQAVGAPDAAMRVSFDSHRVPPDGKRIPREVEIVNVLGELPGANSEARPRRYYLVAHYDSRATDPMDARGDAPGANDDASGVAVLLEAARVIAKARPEATLAFLATAGEEQGLHGARLHAQAAQTAGLDVRGVLSNDIVGDPTSPVGPAHRDRVRVFSEGWTRGLSEERAMALARQGAESESASRQLARFVAEVAAWHGLEVQPRLVLRADRALRGGDHLAFNEAGFPAVRFSVVDEHYDRQHQDVREQDGRRYGDLPEFVDGTYMAGVARLNAATLLHLANAPSTPADAQVVAVELANDTLVRWSASPEPDVAGYEVVWRRTTCADWERVRDVGTGSSATLPINKDNFFVGVRAYDRSGYRSPVAFAPVAKE